MAGRQTVDSIPTSSVKPTKEVLYLFLHTCIYCGLFAYVYMYMYSLYMYMTCFYAHLHVIAKYGQHVLMHCTCNVLLSSYSTHLQPYIQKHLLQ